ncbi:hypothetical protein M0R45_026216 [Rubus argutus]|uniref:Uncharacterized protein n=1 Tax=Rubus argutus TaxID=59490 RepID=A0AAW1WWY8_RUBAR
MVTGHGSWVAGDGAGDAAEIHNILGAVKGCTGSSLAGHCKMAARHGRRRQEWMGSFCFSGGEHPAAASRLGGAGVLDGDELGSFCSARAAAM